MTRKLGLTLAAYEVADNNNLSYLRGLTVFRYLPLAPWGLVAPFALFGMVACWPRRRELDWLYGCVASYVLTLMVFFVSSRLRAPLWPLVIAFAAAGIVRLSFWLRSRQWAQFALGAALVITLAGLSQVLAPALDSQNPFLLVNAGQLSLRLRDPRQALSLCGRAIKLRPGLATAHACHGVSRAQLGNRVGALQDLRRAVALDPQAVAARLNLAILLGQSGATEEAHAELQAVARLAPNDPSVKATLQAVQPHTPPRK
jgi:tetratricopeptide (TPR) repeat protein